MAVKLINWCSTTITHSLFTGTCDSGNGGCHHNCTNKGNGTMCSCAPKYILMSDKKTCSGNCYSSRYII